ncbi:hypothetical protein MKW94_000736 [Papaver nudicaule]|uniref:25S rRNA (uridine-N(3))-methyltransferase BMT5-like domain-containing protein n=1 Tax=Papaver nudicaule TaxID=74823 RepID=A0AA42B197_PAPNU|nr:hypothetical protein [Papaver nudicaule]
MKFLSFFSCLYIYFETLNRRLPSSKQHTFDLWRLGCLVLHESDVHIMPEYPELVNRKFDRIIYNFPHAGHWPELHEKHPELIRRHKELLSGFFKRSRKFLKEDGEVHVAHRDDEPYNIWGIVKLAKKAGLFLIEKVKFRPEDYPSYSNKRGSRIRSGGSFNLGDSPMTFKFSPVKRNQNMVIHI